MGICTSHQRVLTPTISAPIPSTPPKPKAPVTRIYRTSSSVSSTDRNLLTPSENYHAFWIAIMDIFEPELEHVMQSSGPWDFLYTNRDIRTVLNHISPNRICDIKLAKTELFYNRLFWAAFGLLQAFVNEPTANKSRCNELELVLWCEIGCIQTVQSHVKRFPELNCAWSKQYPLRMAYMHNHLDIAAFLLKQKNVCLLPIGD
jgi:hypothetical protein